MFRIRGAAFVHASVSVPGRFAIPVSGPRSPRNESLFHTPGFRRLLSLRLDIRVHAAGLFSLGSPVG